MKWGHEDMLDDQTWDQLGTQREDALVWSPSLGDVKPRHGGPREGSGEDRENGD